MAPRLPKGMSWDDYLKFVEANPKYTLSLDTGMPIKGRPNAEMPKMVPPADPFSGLSARAEEILARRADQARQAATDAKKFLTEPQKLPHPVTGLPYQVKDPVTGKLGGYAMGFTPAQTAARVGLPTVGAAGAGYLGLQGAENRRARDAAATDAEVGARQAEELRMQQDAIADQSAYRPMGPSRVPEMLTPIEGGDERMMQTMPIPPRVADLVARAQASAPRRAAPAVAAAAPAADEGILSKIFGGDPYKGMSSAKLMERSSENPDDAAAFFRADKALRAERPEMFAAGGAASGGGDKPHKDAALHKALEIIHHLISRR